MGMMTWDPKLKCLEICRYPCSCTITWVQMETVNHQTWSNWNFIFKGEEVLMCFFPQGIQLEEKEREREREREAVEINGDHSK